MIEKIAYYLERNDEEPNVSLANELSSSKDIEGIKEIVLGLSDKKSQIANDCIKVLYEIGEIEPNLIADYVLDFIEILKSKNNRLVWGGMTVLSEIVSLRPKEIHENMNAVINAYTNGSVITRDYSISVFAGLAKADRSYEKDMLEILVQHLKACRPKEIAQHAERASICINKTNAKVFTDVLLDRKNTLSDSQRKRIDKLIRKIENSNLD